MAVGLNILSCASVEIMWENTIFEGSSGKIYPSAINYLEMAVATCIGRGITAYIVDKGIRDGGLFFDAVQGFGDIGIDVSEQEVKEEADDADWIVNIVCTTKSSELADVLTAICDDCTILKMLIVDVALNFVNNPYLNSDEIPEGELPV